MEDIESYAYYNGGARAYKQHICISQVERIVLKNIEIEERERLTREVLGMLQG